MPSQQTIKSDILIAGAGFAGSLTAMALHQRGFEVCLVEKNRHPRFAIGESSTPIADMILRDLSTEYNLPWLHDFSRYGSWQEFHPELVCGLKRGFSYYKHKPGKSFTTDDSHSNELLVAASSSDENSDTNWLRADFDSFLVEKVKEYGIPYFDRTEITSGKKDGDWTFSAVNPDGVVQFESDFFIDATGSAGLLEKLLNIKCSSSGFLTDSRAIYSHFENVPRWSTTLKKMGIADDGYPYNPDHSALHHLLDEGWLWMLRFNNDRTSLGLMLDRGKNKNADKLTAAEEWESVLSTYPSLQKMLGTALLSETPGNTLRTGRLQRVLSKAHGPGWAALPHTAGFVDPLHSTGIAHTLSGVEKILRILTENRNDEELLAHKLLKYERSVFRELKMIDLLVAGCYEVLQNFELFNIWSMLYFTAAIRYEQERLKGEQPSHFLSADHPKIRRILNDSYLELKPLAEVATPSDNEIKKFRERIRKRIEPWNIAGLLDQEMQNMYRHTAVQL